MLRARHDRAAHRRHPRRRRGPDDGRRRPAASGSTTASTRPGSRRSATRSSRWPELARAAGAPRDRRRRRAAAAGTDAAASTIDARGARVLAVRATTLARVRLRPEPRHGVLGPPDGHGPDGRRPARPRRATRAAGSGAAGAADAVVAGPLRRRRLAVPDRDRGQPDDRRSWPSPGGSPGRSSPRPEAERRAARRAQPVRPRSAGSRRPRAARRGRGALDLLRAAHPAPRQDDQRDADHDHRAGDDLERRHASRRGRCEPRTTATTGLTNA